MEWTVALIIEYLKKEQQEKIGEHSKLCSIIQRFDEQDSLKKGYKHTNDSNELFQQNKIACSKKKSDSLNVGIILGLNEFQLMFLLDINFSEARSILNCISYIITLNGPLRSKKTALTLLKLTPTVIQSPLSFLKLQPGYLTEIVGRAGVGKTQLCFTCTVDTVQIYNKGCIYIDTENKFSVDRIVELIKNRGYGHYSKSEEFLTAPLVQNNQLVYEIADRIIVYSPKKNQQLFDLLESEEFKTLLTKKNIGLIIVDSIAALILHNFSSENILKRQTNLSKLSSRLKFLAETFHIPVLVVNQVYEQSRNIPYNINEKSLMNTIDNFGIINTSSIQEHKNTSSINTFSEVISVQPALGNTWFHCVNVRVLIESTSQNIKENSNSTSNIRKARLIKAPSCPELECFFKITTSGVKQC